MDRVSGTRQSSEGRESRMTLAGDSVLWGYVVFDKRMENQDSDLNYWVMEWEGDKVVGPSPHILSWLESELDILYFFG